VRTPLTPPLSRRERESKESPLSPSPLRGEREFKEPPLPPSGGEGEGEGGISPLDPELSQHSVPRLHWFDLDRRRFLQVLGGGVLVCLAAPGSGVAQESGRARESHELPKDLAAWLHIDKDGRVTVFTGKVEMGQNIRTSLSQQVAEELRVSVDSIRMVMGDTDLCPWDAGTFGSRTTPTMGPQLRAVAATAREALIDLAAARWKVSRDGLTAENGKILNPATKQSISYAELTRGEKLVQTLPADAASAPVSPASSWKIAGTPVPKVDGRDFVTGAHRYASDMTRPGMLHGKVLRPVAFEATLLPLNAAKTAAIPGVQVVSDGDFAGVVAPDAYTAERALAALTSEARWTRALGQPSNATLFEYLKKKADAGSDRAEPRVTGSIEQGLASADVKLSQTYTVEYIAHAPLEPRAAVAEWDKNGKLTVWTGSQRPFAVREELATAFRIPSERVRVIIPDTGSAYGGKHTGDAAVEAARLSKAAGKPVKVVWTREEEFTWAYLRPAGVIEVRSGARNDGTLVAWEFHNYNSGPAGIATPYDVANQKIQYHPVKSPLRQGSYRALAATANHFARESHMDELAHEIGMDPLAFRLKNLSDARLKAVFEAAADKFGWAKRKAAPGRRFGIAGGNEKGGYIALCAEVEVQGEPPSRQIHIRRIAAAFECGAVVNPGGLRNQVEGAIVQGIGGALFEAIRFENGRITNPHFSQYRLPRFPDVPSIDLVILDRKDLPSAGAGEAPIVGLAPAVASAIFEATGVRLRSLPLTPDRAPEKPSA
jgi:nicotinate dehydrogenase subunit B